MTIAQTVARNYDQHVTLEVECIDRMYLNVYVPRPAVRKRGRGILPQASQAANGVVGIDESDQQEVRRGD